MLIYPVQMANDPLPHRAIWGQFPDVVIVASESSVKKHPDYEQAKQGNVDDAAPAASRLAAATLSPKALQAIQELLVQDSLLVPVHALEGQGLNRIPAGFAQLLSESLGLSVETGIIQANVVNHTGASGWQRLANPPLFEGDVTAGQRYLMIDDFIGQGSTLANLRGHILHYGGIVLGAACLTGRADSSKLALSTQTLDALREKHGSEIEEWWRQEWGYDFSCLTESEAKYLVRVEDADTIRARLAEARSEGDS